MQQTVQQQPYYTKERIEEQLKKYERMSAEFMERGLTPKIVHYVKRIPLICQKLKYIRPKPLHPGDTSEKVMQQILMDAVKQLMLDEFEIVHWVKFIERFEFSETYFASWLFFIALTTKLLLNKTKTKEPFEVHLSRQNPNFYYFNGWISKYGPTFYSDNSDLIKCHQIFQKLQKGYLPQFNFDEWKQRKQEEDMMERGDMNEVVDEILSGCPSRPSLSN